MDKVKQYIIAKICGLSDSSDFVTEAQNSEGFANALLEKQTITKDDIFSVASNGKSFFETKEAWQNIDKLADLIKSNGETLSCSDFDRKIKDDKTMIEMAKECSCLEMALSPDLWVGHIHDLENLWYTVKAAATGGEKAKIIDLKRDVAKLEGTTLREDELGKMDITRQMIATAVKTGSFETINAKFSAHDDYLRVSDLFIYDHIGDHMLDMNPSWDHFEILVKELSAHGEVFEAEDFLRHIGDRSSMLKKAIDFSTADKIFTEKVWGDRLDEALKLIAHIPADQLEKTKALEFVESLLEEQFEGRIAAALKGGKENFTEALNKEHKDLVPNFYPVRALGFEKNWKRIRAVQTTLASVGAPLEGDDLRLISGSKENTCFMIAAGCGQFEEALKIFAASNDHLSIEDLSYENKDGKTLVDILADNDDLDLLLNPRLWVDRSEDLSVLWDLLPATKRAQIDFPLFQSKVARFTLRDYFAQSAHGESDAAKAGNDNQEPAKKKNSGSSPAP